MADYESMKVAELKAECKKLGLSQTGTKSELIEKLKSAGSKAEETTTKGKRKASGETEEKQSKKPKESSSSSSLDYSDILDYLQDDGWKKMLKSEFEQKYFKDIITFLNSEARGGKVIFPPKQDIFNALNYTPFDKVKVVIIGQDPYFNQGQAHGICFSVQKGVKVPPSLNTIYKELERTIPNFKIPKHGYLEQWAKQGVLMLNATLTVEQKLPNSHAKCGWMTFTDAIIKIVNDKKENVVFLLWGGFAQKIGKKIDSQKHHILESPHPSPMSGGGFKGCNCFAECNKILKKHKIGEIDWTLDP